jgi:hypothetical protein
LARLSSALAEKLFSKQRLGDETLPSKKLGGKIICRKKRLQSGFKGFLNR